MAHLSPADLWGLELIKKWKSLGNKNTPRLYKDTVFWLSRGFVGWAADKNKTTHCVRRKIHSYRHKQRQQNDLSLQLLFEHKMNDLNNTEVIWGV